MLEVADEELEPASSCSSPSPTAADADADDPTAVANPVGAAGATVVTEDVVEGCMMDTKARLS